MQYILLISEGFAGASRVRNTPNQWGGDAAYCRAIATQLCAGSPLASQTLFDVYLGIPMRGGLILHDPRIRRLFSLAQK
jgi:hypothetical protein